MVLISADVQDGDDDYQLCARCDTTKYVYALLRTIDFREAILLQHACITALDDGLRVTVDELRSMQANVYIRHDLFSQYTLGEHPFSFKVPLHVLCECLNLYANEPSSSTSAKLTYAGYGEPLRVVLDKAGVVTDCRIRTLQADDHMQFTFNDQQVVTKIIMKTDPLREIISELDKPCDVVRISVSATPDKCMRLSAGSKSAVTVAVNIPGHIDAVQLFISQQPQTYSYRLSMLKQCVRAMQLSNKVSLRIDDQGTLAMQLMVQHDNDLNSFIEFFMAPEEEDPLDEFGDD